MSYIMAVTHQLLIMIAFDAKFGVPFEQHLLRTSYILVCVICDVLATQWLVVDIINT